MNNLPLNALCIPLKRDTNFRLLTNIAGKELISNIQYAVKMHNWNEQESHKLFWTFVDIQMCKGLKIFYKVSSIKTTRLTLNYYFGYEPPKDSKMINLECIISRK